ncbi:MAG: DUF488 domain-containing protein [Christensenellales bacterium]|jgi:uncharacterized protein YeaO (DUF488 family)
MPFAIKRIYEPYDESDGVRLLVDRLWPRGVSKDAARIDAWPKELTPSPQLRTWFGHKAENFAEFAALYRAELDARPEAQATARQIIRQSADQTVTLLYAAKDPQINHAILLKQYLEDLSTSSKGENAT